MKKLLLFIISLLFILGIVSCTKMPDEGFAIYLTNEDVFSEKMPVLSQIKIANTPIIGMNDVVTYDATKHQINLTDDASERVSNLRVPTDGTSFVVCVNKKPVYRGVFWAVYSSAFVPASCVVVSYPLSQTVKISGVEMIQMNPNILELSYYGTDDPRNKTEIIESFERAGKLTAESQR